MRILIRDHTFLRKPSPTWGGPTDPPPWWASCDTCGSPYDDHAYQMLSDVVAFTEAHRKPVIVVTPTWCALLPAFLTVLDSSRASIESRRYIEGELRRMAALADRFVASQTS